VYNRGLSDVLADNWWLVGLVIGVAVVLELALVVLVLLVGLVGESSAPVLSVKPVALRGLASLTVRRGLALAVVVVACTCDTGEWGALPYFGEASDVSRPSARPAGSSSFLRSATWSLSPLLLMASLACSESFKKQWQQNVGLDVSQLTGTKKTKWKKVHN
jgi:hypothetical protein